MVHVSVQVVSSYVTPWLSNTYLISVISFVITLYMNGMKACKANFKLNPVLQDLPSIHASTFIPM
jgi:hypothetical protein